MHGQDTLGSYIGFLLSLSLPIAEGSKCEPGVLKTSNWMASKQESGGGVFIAAGSHQLLFRCFQLLTYKLYEVNNISKAMGQTAHR